MERKSVKPLRAREAALAVLYEVEHKGAYANLALDRALSRYGDDGTKNSLVTELVNGTIRMRKHLDWVLNLFLSKKLEAQNPWLLEILRMSVYQLLFMDNIPDYAIVDEACDLTRCKTGGRLSAVVNAVLRNIVRNRANIEYPDPVQEPVKYLSVYYSHPEWMVTRWVQRYGWEKTAGLLEYNNRRPEVVLRTNVLKVTREELIRRLEEEGVRCAASPLTPWAVRVQDTGKPLRKLGGYSEGWFYIQEESSMLVSAACSPRPGQTVYDLAAGVGGKTSHLAELMGNRGVIRAAELFPHKVKLLQENMERLGIDVVETWVGDGLGSLPEKWGEGDVVVVDAPCSGLGVLRRRADLRWRRQEGDIDHLSQMQRQFLKRGSQLVRTGGILVYSTCTLEPQENEEVVYWFLKEDPRFALDSLTEALSFFPFESEDTAAASQGMLTLFPPRYDTDGMFIARLRRLS